MACATPRRCGLYETTREIVAAERTLGLDARIVDPRPGPFYPGPEDRGVPLADMDWACEADVVFSHSGHDGTPVENADNPIVVVAHGRPLSSFIGEQQGGAPAYSYHVTRSRQERYRACVTFWPQHEPYLRSLWGGKPVHVVTPPVDTDYWCPGETSYDFAGKGGGYNVVLTDPWARKDVSPLHSVHAFHLFRSICPDARLHVYAVNSTRGIGALRRMLGEGLGVVQGWASDLRAVYRAADMLITPHRIATRSVREAMACGLQVVSGADCHPEDIEAFAMLMAKTREDPRPRRDKRAAADFNTRDAARTMREIADRYAGVTCGD